MKEELQSSSYLRQKLKTKDTNNFYSKLNNDQLVSEHIQQIELLNSNGKYHIPESFK